MLHLQGEGKGGARCGDEGGARREPFVGVAEGSRGEEAAAGGT